MKQAETLNSIKKTMVVFDTETSGLMKPVTAPLRDQPNMIEFAAIKVDYDTLEELDRFEFLCKPPQPIEPIITNITKLTNEMLDEHPPFAHFFPKVQQFFFGTYAAVAHNVTFDIEMLTVEMRRIQKTRTFPFPIEHICTVERSFDIRGHRLKLSQLHEILIGEPFKDAHRAMADCEALLRCVRVLREKGKL